MENTKQEHRRCVLGGAGGGGSGFLGPRKHCSPQGPSHQHKIYTRSTTASASQDQEQSGQQELLQPMLTELPTSHSSPSFFRWYCFVHICPNHCHSLSFYVCVSLTTTVSQAGASGGPHCYMECPAIATSQNQYMTIAGCRCKLALKQLDW